MLARGENGGWTVSAGYRFVNQAGREATGAVSLTGRKTSFLDCYSIVSAPKFVRSAREIPLRSAE
jgi:hypothetical protein